MNRKPITEHLADLPIEYREEALRLHKESGWANDEFERRSDALVNAFPWQGRWSKFGIIYHDLKSKGL